MNVVVGTYEELLLGYSLETSGGKYKLEQKFTDHSHVASVKNVDISPKGILASGSSDESIHLFSLKTGVELGSLIQHDGSITSLEFHGSSHLFSTSEDGRICIWQTANWECIKTLKGHKGAVYDVSVHSSGKLALSVGKDKTLRTWNLITGRSAFIVNLKEVANFVRWSPDGERFIVLFDRRLDVYNVKAADVCYSITLPYRLHSAVFTTNDVLILGGEEGHMEVHSINQQKQIHKYETGCTRVKSMAIQELGTDEFLVVLASSEGLIKVLNITLEQTSASIKMETEIDTKFRLLCITVRPQVSLKEEKSEVKTDKDSSSVKKKKSRKPGNKHVEEVVVNEASDDDTTPELSQRTVGKKGKNKKRKSSIEVKNGGDEKTQKNEESSVKRAKKRKNANVEQTRGEDSQVKKMKKKKTSSVDQIQGEDLKVKKSTKVKDLNKVALKKKKKSGN